MATTVRDQISSRLLHVFSCLVCPFVVYCPSSLLAGVPNYRCKSPWQGLRRQRGRIRNFRASRMHQAVSAGSMRLADSSGGGGPLFARASRVQNFSPTPHVKFLGRAPSTSTSTSTSAALLSVAVKNCLSLPFLPASIAHGTSVTSHCPAPRLLSSVFLGSFLILFIRFPAHKSSFCRPWRSLTTNLFAAAVATLARDALRHFQRQAAAAQRLGLPRLQ